MVLKIHICKHTTVHWRDFSKRNYFLKMRKNSPYHKIFVVFHYREYSFA